VETDASDFALGCILSQYVDKKLHPVAFHSRKLNSAERNYDIHDKELLAILEAFTEWKHYLEGTKHPITVYTDHQNLQSFLTTKAWSGRQIRWAQKLTDFNFKIVYRPGTRGGKPDALSRRPEYRPEGGATHGEQSILQAKHFQVSMIWANQEPFEMEYGTGRKLQIKKLSEKAKTPCRGTQLAAGLDLFSIETKTIPAKGQAVVDTGIAIAVPDGT